MFVWRAAVATSRLEPEHTNSLFEALVSLEDRYCDTPLKSACVSGHADVAQALAKASKGGYTRWSARWPTVDETELVPQQ